MKRSQSHIVLLVDKSGSMSSLRNEVVESINNLITEQQRLGTDDATFTLAFFNTDYTIAHDAVPLTDAKPLTKDDYRPCGGTALLDAMGRTIDSLRNRNVEGKVIVAIVTDGHENLSREYTGERIPTMVKQCTDELEWEFVYLGADLDAFDIARQTGIHTAQMVMRVVQGRPGDISKSAAVLNNTVVKSRLGQTYDIGTTYNANLSDVDAETRCLIDSANNAEESGS